MASKRSEYEQHVLERLRALPSVRKDDRKAKQVREALAKGGRTQRGHQA